VRRRLDHHPGHHEHVEEDAGGADVLQALQVSKKREGKGDKESKTRENNHPEVSCGFDASQLSHHWRA